MLIFRWVRRWLEHRAGHLLIERWLVVAPAWVRARYSGRVEKVLYTNTSIYQVIGSESNMCSKWSVFPTFLLEHKRNVSLGCKLAFSVSVEIQRIICYISQILLNRLLFFWLLFYKAFVVVIVLAKKIAECVRKPECWYQFVHVKLVPAPSQDFRRNSRPVSPPAAR